MLRPCTNGAESGSCCTDPVWVCKSAQKRIWRKWDRKVGSPKPPAGREGTMWDHEGIWEFRPHLAAEAPNCNLIRLFATLFSRLPVNIPRGILVDIAATGARDFAVVLSHF